VITGTLTAADGIALHTITWSAEDPRGRILLVHGLGEHAARYDSLAKALASRGYSAFAHDQRGHGRSPGRRGYIASFDVFVDDLAAAVDEAERTLPGPGGVFLYGHSLGALVLGRYLQTRRPKAPGAILSAPWLGTAVPIPWWKELAAAGLRRIAPAVRVPTEIDPGRLTADAALQQAYLDDPLISHGVAVALYDAVLAAQRLALRDPLPEIPILVLIPLADRVVDVGTTEGWVRGAGSNVQVVRLPGVLHEPHNDLGREDVYRRIADWLDSKTLDSRTRDARSG
jgi:lysophospholipase